MRVIRDRPRSVDLDEFLSRPLFAHLATSSEEGPRESPVWFLWEDGALWILGSRRTDSFPARIEREPRCAIGIIDFDRITGVVQHVGFRGRGTVEKLDGQREKRLLARYLGPDEERWDARFRESVGDPDSIFVRIEPETAINRDVSYSSG
jgi:nitroimidazol reductase NimA-like FMN-containing flavoprotein (pyridoxamine 5'-phosphate oxidase superfamily)